MPANVVDAPDYDSYTPVGPVVTGRPPPPQLPGGGGPVTTLNNGQLVSGSAARGERKDYRISVPSGTTLLAVQLTGSGDADLYVRRGGLPAAGTYDCRPYLPTSNETCSFESPPAGDWFITVFGHGLGSSNYTLVARFATPSSGLGGGTGVSLLSASDTLKKGEEKKYKVTVPSGADLLTVQIVGTGDADLYVRKGEEPTIISYDCAPYRLGSNETCTIQSPAAGDWFIMIHGYSDLPSSYHVTARYSTSAPGGGAGGTVLSNALPVSDGVTRGQQKNYRIAVPSGAKSLTVEITGTEDADLYVRRGSPPALNIYHCRPYLVSSNERCTFQTPPAGDWFVMVAGYAPGVSSYTLKASFTTQ